MIAHESAGQELAKGAGRLVGHLAAIVGGFILMIVGLAMGVTIVLLPFGIPIGLVGLGVFGWGLFGWGLSSRSQKKEVPAPPPA
jgi:hypothetical protein